jgi:hypothetical protein
MLIRNPTIKRRYRETSIRSQYLGGTSNSYVQVMDYGLSISLGMHIDVMVHEMVHS